MIQHGKKQVSPLSFLTSPHVAVIEARFYDHINNLMVAGVKAVLDTHGATHEIITVPGALEIPAMVQFAATREKGKKFDAFVVLGCVIRGATTHYETVCNESARGVTDVTLKYNLAVGNGILTVENEAQALERADKKLMDKGGGAALAALTMLHLKKNYE